MKPSKHRVPWTLMLVVSLFALLGLLAVLQHRWLGEVSQGERERMQANLRIAASNFTQEIDGELTRAYATFQMEPTVAREKRPQYFAGCMARWTASALYPRLVKSLFLADTLDGHVTLSRFNDASNQFENSDWPPELDRARGYFDEQPQPVESLKTRTLGLVFPRIDDDIPAILVPLLSFPMLDARLPSPSVTREEDSSGSAATVVASKKVLALSLAFAARHRLRKITMPISTGYAIVVLDTDYIRHELIPMLADRYFSSSGSLDYNVAVVSRKNPEDTIYSSDSDISGRSISSPDATADLFGLRLDRLASLTRDSLATTFRGTPGTTDSSNRSFRIFSISQSRDAPGNPLAGETEHRWQLLLKHRAGSLEAFVASSRRRNLVVSFGVLLLLALSLTMIMLSTRRAQRLARQQMEFVAGVSHELRTPLAVICSAGENLADGVIDDRLQIKRYGEVIRNEGRRLTEMVEQVLEFAGIQSGRKAYNITAVHVGNVMDRVLIGLEQKLAARGFEVEIRIATHLPPVMADGDALRRAIQNLIDNAMKYSGESRWIGLSARTEVVAGKLEVQISVSDKGMGISSSDLSRVFEPFHRGQAPVAAQIHGNGLGLSLVKHIVEAQGGSVEVSSVEGEGTCFTLHLPAAAEIAEASPSPQDVTSNALH